MKGEKIFCDGYNSKGSHRVASGVMRVPTKLKGIQDLSPATLSRVAFQAIINVMYEG